MPIVHRAPARDFAQIRNAVLRDERLSLRARGLLAYLLTYPADWQIPDSTTLATKCREGRDAIRKAMAELRAAGYLQQTRRRGERGRWVTETVVYGLPPDSDESANVQVGPGTEKPASEDQSSEDQSSESQALSTEYGDEDCYEHAHALGRDSAAPRDEDQETEQGESWRQQDLRLFEDTLGALCASVVKHSPRWAPGHFSAPALYKALAKPVDGDNRSAMRYPGKVLAFKDETHQLEDWLWETGIEPCTEGHGKRRSA